MSLIPRNKKPEGLIDGCFGPSSYCERCEYEKEPENMGDRFCSMCKKIDSISESMKAALMSKFDGNKLNATTIKNVKASIEGYLKQMPGSKVADINSHINIQVSIDYADKTKINIKLVPRDQIGNDFLRKASNG
jgi:hypothetical protein